MVVPAEKEPYFREPDAIVRRFCKQSRQLQMSFDIQETVNRARRDLAKRLQLAEADVTQQSIEQADFPDASLGAPIEDEMSAQLITPGQRIRLTAAGEIYEYRANETQLRLYNFQGDNFRI